MATKKKAVPAVDCREVRVLALEEGLRAATLLRRALEDRDPFAKMLDIPRAAVEAYDQKIKELQQKVVAK